MRNLQQQEPKLSINWKKHLRAFAVLISVSFITYFNSFFNDFVSDDLGAIVHNPHIGNLWFQIKSGSFPSVVESILYLIGGGQPLLFHINSVIWHIGVVLLVYILIYLVTENVALAFVTTLIFAVHPIHTEAVTWISGLPYLLYSFFGLFGLIVFILVDKGILSKRWIFVSALAFGLAIFSSEKATVLPLLCVGYVLLFSSFRKTFKLFIPVFVLTLLASIHTFFLFQERATVLSSPSVGGLKTYNPFLQIPTAISNYLQLFLWPFNLSFYHEAFLLSSATYIFYLLTTIALIIFIIFLLLKKQRILLFGCAIFIVGLLPTLLPVYINAIVAERYVYLPSIGASLLAALSLLKIKRYDGGLFKLILGAVVIAYIGLTIQRNFDWKNEDSLWPATLKTAPNSIHARYNMGDYYTRHGDIPAALEQYQQAFVIDAQYIPVLQRLGMAYIQVGEYQKAKEILEKAKKINPNSLEVTMTLAILHINQKQLDKGMEYLEKAEEIDPTAPQIYNSMAGVYFEKGDIQQARLMLEKALSLDPNFTEAQKNLDFLNQPTPAKIK